MAGINTSQLPASPWSHCTSPAAAPTVEFVTFWELPNDQVTFWAVRKRRSFPRPTKPKTGADSWNIGEFAVHSEIAP